MAVRLLSIPLLITGLLAPQAPSAPAQSPVPVHDRSGAYTRALGIECAHCHVEGEWTSAAKPAFELTQRMRRMTDALNGGPLQRVAPVTCWTCHRGQLRPARLPRDAWESIAKARADVFVGPYKDRAITMSVYAASLGVTCAHCHVEGEWAADTERKQTARLMTSMFPEMARHFDPTQKPTLQCYMCHQGAVTPAR